MKVKTFINKASLIDELINDWLTQHPDITILHQYIHNDWLKQTIDATHSKWINMVTVSFEYEGD